MTIGAASRVSLACDGVTKVFPVAIQAYAATDLTAILTAPVSAGGGEVTLTLNSDYSLATSGTLSPTAWTLTTLPAAAYLTGYTLQVFANPVQTQQTNYVQGQAFPSAAVQTNFDRLTQMVQRIQDEVSRCIRVPDGDVNPQMLLPTTIARISAALMMDASGNVALGVPNTQLITTALLAPFLNLTQTAAEAAAGVTPAKISYQPGDARRYGSDPTGVLDSTAAFNTALLCNKLVYVIAGTYVCSAPLNMTSGQQLYGDGAATVLQFASGLGNQIVFNGVTGSSVRDLKIKVTGTGGVLKYGGVYLLNSPFCHVVRVEMQGCNWSGVWLDGASNSCTVRSCYFHNFSDPAGTGADIIIYSVSGGGTAAPSGCVFDGNQCLGGGGYGIAIEDPYAAALGGFPSKNIVTNNRVLASHLTYGILVYMPGLTAPASDTYNQITDNYIENISGTCPTNNASGAGIYVVGLGAGATQIVANEIFNCCTGTAARSLAPAGIGLNGIPATVTRPIVSANIINGMTQGDGIDIASSPGGAVVVANSVNMPSTNLGGGGQPGGAQLLGHGIRVHASSDVSVECNQVQVYGAGAGIFVYADGVNITDITLTGGSYETNGTGSSLQVAQNGGFTVSRLNVTGGNYEATGANPDAITLNAVIVGNLTGVTGSCVGTGRGLFINGCTNMRVTGGCYNTSGAVAIGTSGTCTNGYIDKTVNFVGATSLINNAGTGILIEIRTNAVPATGTFAVGDRSEQTVPVVGNPKGWRCTVAGTPGTWVSEGVL